MDKRYKAWSENRAITFILLAPGVMLITGYWYIALLTFMLIAILYNNSAVFLKQRKLNSSYGIYVLGISFVNVIVGVLPYINERSYNPAAFLWFVFVMIILFTKSIKFKEHDE